MHVKTEQISQPCESHVLKLNIVVKPILCKHFTQYMCIRQQALPYDEQTMDMDMVHQTIQDRYVFTGRRTGLANRADGTGLNTE